MPSVLISSSSSLPWRDGATIAGSTTEPWRDGALVAGVRGAAVIPPPPVTYVPPPPSEEAGSTEKSAEFVLPGASVYHAVHTSTVIDTRDGAELQFESMTLSTDDGSIFWSLRAEAAGDLFERLTTLEDPAIIAITLDGILWHFAIEEVERSTEFSADKISVSGRSVTASAGEPYSFPLNWINEEATTAQQIVEQAQAFTGMTIDWQIKDWFVPDKVWTFTGSPLAVVRRVAESVGAVVMSSRADNLVSIVPRYRALPNEWPLLKPDVEIHADAIVSMRFERSDRPPYNGIHLAGQQGGVQGFVRLAGTEGNELAPMQTDLLLTDPDAITQRGDAILGAGGKQARVTITIPVLTGGTLPGVVELGALVRIVQADGLEWTGVVRAVSVQANMPSLMQTLVIERHLKAIEGTVKKIANNRIILNVPFTNFGEPLDFRDTTGNHQLTSIGYSKPYITTTHFAEGGSSCFFPGGLYDRLDIVPKGTTADWVTLKETDNFSIKFRVRPSAVIENALVMRSFHGTVNPHTAFGFEVFLDEAQMVVFRLIQPTTWTSFFTILPAALTLVGPVVKQNVWTGIEIKRVGETYSLLVNGAKSASGTSVVTPGPSPLALSLFGADPYLSRPSFIGYIDSIRATRL